MSVEKSSWLNRTNFKVFTSYYACGVIGWHDACAGALLPYIQLRYGIGYEVVSLLFVGGFIGSITASLVNVPLTKRYGLGKLLVLAAFVQTCAYVFIVAPLPFGVMVMAYAIVGFGTALIDAQANTFVANLPQAELKLGILHAIYGVGGLLSPLVATAFVTAGYTYRYAYLTSLAVSFGNVGLLAAAFQGKHEYAMEPVLPDGDVALQTLASAEIHAPIPGSVEVEEAVKITGPAPTQEAQEQQVVQHQSLLQVLKLRAVWITCCFLFIYVGCEVSCGGWIVTFLLEERNGPESTGYVASGFWGGVALSRVIAVPLTLWIGEKPVIFIYLGVALGLQFVIWFVKSLVGNAVAISLVGFALGPVYPNVISLFVKVAPRNTHTAAIGLAACIGQGGSALFPLFVGLLAEATDIGVLPAAMITLLGAMSAIWIFMPNAVKKRD